MAKRFQFRLERVRALRERAEDHAKEELAAAMTERERWAQRRAEAAAQLERARSGQRVAADRHVSVSDMVAHQAFLERAERTEQSAELDLHRQDAEVDARRTALQHAARERQVLERLKDKQAADHRQAVERAETAELDELALSRHRRAAS